MTPADGSSTRGGSTSVRGRVRSPHISGGRRWLQPTAAGPWDRQTDGSIVVSPNAPYGGGIITKQTLTSLCSASATHSPDNMTRPHLLLSAGACYRVVCPARGALSSKPAACHSCCQTMGQRDRRTPNCYTDPAPYTMQAVSTLMQTTIKQKTTVNNWTVEELLITVEMFTAV